MQPSGGEGTVIAGRYRLGARLGRGGMADVFDAYDQRLARPVAIKLLRPELSIDPGMRARFEREARAAARLNHPSVVSVYDSGEDAGRAFLVMERLPGETLADRMRSGALDPFWLRSVAADVLGALAAAHEQGIVHRDIKPANILLDAEGRAKVGDFGIAKAVRDASPGADAAAQDLTGVGMLIGTVAYLSPEQIEGAAATPQSDLYAVGVVLYEALAGRKPFVGEDALAQARAVVAADPPDIAAARPGVPADLADVIRRAMSRRPEDRYASARSMRAALLGEDRTVLGAPLAGVATRVLHTGGVTAVLP
ncbi:MAG: serine/threonine-protein kinase, partial [Actinomycetota bacterium]|nr:serine/threonine-protein kinase [Actinomycetota bacterium]